MKIKLSTAAVTVALGIMTSLSGAAFAQSSVTIYGIVDIGFVHDSGSNRAGSIDALSGSQLYPSRLGFKGIEDLGDGLAAIFTLEEGFATDTGAYEGGVGFGRQAFVGLKGRFGAVTVGHQYTPLYNATIIYDPFLNGLSGAYTRLFPITRRADNAVVYNTPDTLGGFNSEALYSFGEVAGDNSAGRQMGISGGYNNGPFSIKAIYHSAASVPVAPALSVTTKTAALAGSYNFGVAKVFAMYEDNKTDDISPLKTRDWLGGISIPFGGVHTILASFIHHENKQVASANANQAAIGYTYSLSRRTTLYASYGVLKNGSNASLQTPGTLGGSDRVFIAGINHTF
jgi:predicted porin